MAVLALALYEGLTFAASQTIAVLAAMNFNFALNNLFTYRDQRLRGWDWVRGLLSFCVVCSVGAVANVGIATFVYSAKSVWWLAGLAGALGWCSMELCTVGLLYLEAPMSLRRRPTSACTDVHRCNSAKKRGILRP